MFQSTAEGRFISVNPALARMSGYGSPREMIEDITSINNQYYADPNDRAKYLNALEEKGFVEDYVMRLKRRDGSLFWASNSSRVARDEEGTILYYEGTVEDITGRKSAEEDARRLAAIVRHSGELVNLSDFDGRMIFLNEAGSKMLGIEQGTVETTNFIQVIPDHLKNLVRSELLPTLLDSGNWEGDLQYVNLKTGGVTDVHALVFVIDDPDALHHKYLANISRDISLSKQTERVLRENEERLRGITNNIPGAVFQFHAYDNGKYGMTYVSGRLTELFGLPTILDDLFPKLLSYIFEEDRERFLDSIRRAVETAVSWNFEGRFINPSGETIWFNGLATPTRYGDRLVFDGILLNIKERKEAEEMSRQSEEKFTKVFMMVPECIAITRMKDGLLIDVNLGFEEITGWRRQEAIGRTSFAINFWVDKAAREAMLDELQAGRDVLDREFQFRRKDGSLRTGIYSARSISIAGESCLVFALQDVTDRRRLEEDLKHLESQLLQSQKMEAIGTLAGGVAHDFNNILTVLIGCGTLLQMGLDESNPLRMHAEQIISASQKAANLTRSLLAFSRQQPISLAPLNVNERVKSIEKLLKRLITEDIELRISLAFGNIVVMADPTQIDQIFFNLATNARDAMPRGGVLTIETGFVEIDEPSARRHGFRGPGPYALIAVSDTGTGMEKATMEKIFEPFFTTKEAGRGTGLGLATVYGIVKQHNGNITVHSEPDKGTAFHIYLPVTNVHVRDEIDHKPAPLGGNETILIAEDNSDVRFFMKETLKQHGYTTVEAVDGEDAVNKFLGHGHIDLLVVDSVMPKRNGREVYEEIRKADPHVKVLFTSGYTKDVVLDKGIEEKEFAFLPKPIWPSVLLAKVREMLDE
jgi:two-component system cell cycle sensor histidine kinase/response regulator CckA